MNELSVNDVSEKEFNILILSSHSEQNESGLHITARRLADECIKAKVSFYILFTESARLELNDDGTYTAYNIDDKKGFVVSHDKTIAITRGSVMAKFNARNIISQLEKGSIFCINYRDTIEICSDKYRTILRISESGVPTPRTASIQGLDDMDNAIERVGGKFPFILKTLQGSKGIGVIMVESAANLKSTLQLIWKINEDEEMLLQEYIKHDFDVRVHVLGGDVIASMKRHNTGDDFRSNYSLGGKVEAYEMSEEEKEVCIKASKAVGGSWTGVDYILKNKKPFVIEVNSSPGSEGIEKATKENIVKEVLEWSMDKKNWNKKTREIGYKEIVEINGLSLDAKFDTGNGMFCVIHADKHKIDKDKKLVYWWDNGKKYTNEYLGMVEIEVGGVEGNVETRPKIHLDMFFNGTLYKDVIFTIGDRTGRTTVLTNRKFMKRANVSVNPAQKYLVTEKNYE